MLVGNRVLQFLAALTLLGSTMATPWMQRQDQVLLGSRVSHLQHPIPYVAATSDTPTAVSATTPVSALISSPTPALTPTDTITTTSVPILSATVPASQTPSSDGTAEPQTAPSLLAVTGTVTITATATMEASATPTPSPTSTAATTPTAASAQTAVAHPGADIRSLDSSTDRFTQLDDGLIRAQISDGPIWSGPQQGQARDPHLVAASDGIVSAPGLPFDLAIHRQADRSALASLRTSDGVSLGIGLVTSNGTTSSPVTGQLQDDSVTYAAPAIGPNSGISVRATTSGLALHVTLPDPTEAGNIGFALALDPKTHLQDANGEFIITRPITEYDDHGGSYVMQNPEYVIEPPVVRDSGGAADSAVLTAPISAELTSAPAGPLSLALHIDPAWLHDPHRAFPVTIDLKVVTGDDHLHTRMFGTVSKCSPDMPAPRTDMVVGRVGTCVYNGQAYFELWALPYTAMIHSAILRLYTPDHSGPTGITVYRNAPAGPAAAGQSELQQSMTWQTAPQVLAGEQGTAQSGSSGHWQTWDITNWVREWVQNRATNHGVTLIGDSVPIRFASPWETSALNPSTAPSLDITYRVQPHSASLISDGAHTIYGVSGTFSADWAYDSQQRIPDPPGQCTNSPVAQCNAALKVYGVSNPPGGNSYNTPPGVQLSYMRFTVSLDPCVPNTSTLPGWAWWDSQYADTGNVGRIGDLLYSAYKGGIIPIVQLTPSVTTNNQCSSPTPMTPILWETQVSDFLSYTFCCSSTHGGWYPDTSKPIYFEIGNEENVSNQGGGLAIPGNRERRQL